MSHPIDPLTREALRRLNNRIGNLVTRGVVHLADDGKKLQLLQFGALADETIDGAEHFQPYGFSSIPLSGAEAIAIFPSGDRAHALVVAVSDRRYRPTGGQPGEVTVYNNTGAKITMTKDGDIIGTPAPGRKFMVDDGAGGIEPVVTRSEFLSHGHPTAGTGPVSSPVVAPSSTSPTIFPGTTLFETK